jgi:dephospho-CoA kinase
MKVIGLTGGIGSGKTTVAHMFEELDVPVFIADKVSKNILANDPIVIEQIKQLLGAQSYKEQNGSEEPDRAFIASQVFRDKSLLQSLNEILHPKVRENFQTWKADQLSPYIIYEAAILFESGSDKFCDQVVLVTAPLQERIIRVMDRDGVTKEDVEIRLKNQWTDQDRLDMAHYVIINKDIQQTEQYVNNLHQFLLKK